MTRLALFDCDGTLVNSAANICAAMDAAFGASELAAPPHGIVRGVVGLSLPDAMRALLPDGDPAMHMRLTENYKTAFQRLRAEALVDEPLYPGIADALDALEAEGWRLGVATGKSDRGLRLCLACHALEGRFATLQTADRHPSKPHPAMALAAMAETGATPATTIVIGDTSFDMQMARAAGAGAIGVAWGYHPPERLLAAGAHAIAVHPDELIGLMESVT